MNLRIIMLLMIALPLQAEEIVGKVARVIDGDTCIVEVDNADYPSTPLRIFDRPPTTDYKDKKTLLLSASSAPLRDTLKIRLAHIDAPESKQPYNKESTAALSKLILGKEVTIQYTKKDRYGRIIGTLYVSRPQTTDNGLQSINSQLVALGVAWHYKKYSKDKSIASSETTAQEKQLGLWVDKDAVAPWVFRKR